MSRNASLPPLRAGRAVGAGLIATACATALWLLEPWIGLPRLAVGQVLSHFIAVATAYLSPGPVVGWSIHFLFGALLGLVYARFFVGRVSGRPLLRGLLYGGLVFLAAQLVFTPLVGAGIFSRGDLPLLIGSLLGHLAYGGVLGSIYGVPVANRP